MLSELNDIAQNVDAESEIQRKQEAGDGRQHDHRAAALIASGIMAWATKADTAPASAKMARKASLLPMKALHSPAAKKEMLTPSSSRTRTQARDDDGVRNGWARLQLPRRARQAIAHKFVPIVPILGVPVDILHTEAVGKRAAEASSTRETVRRI